MIRSGSSSEAGSEAGSATVWVLVGCLFVLAAAGVVVALAAAIQERHRAAAVADLAALAAARATLEPVPCRAAARVAAANDAALAACAVHDSVATIRVTVRSTGWLAWAGSAAGAARAGPVGAGGDPGAQP